MEFVRRLSLRQADMSRLPVDFWPTTNMLNCHENKKRNQVFLLMYFIWAPENCCSPIHLSGCYSHSQADSQVEKIFELKLKDFSLNENSMQFPNPAQREQH